MRGTLLVTTNLGRPATTRTDGRFVVRAEVHADGASVADIVNGQLRANVVAKAFEDALNAPNLEVVQAYVRQHVNGTLTVLTAARILDRAGVRA